jgi:hypothetical protein
VSVASILNEIEAAGAVLRLDAGTVRVWYPGEGCRRELARHVAFLRTCRAEVAACLQARRSLPGMPPGVRLLEWRLKEPPVGIDSCSVVTDSALFARSTLEQLRIALEEPKRWVGWSVPQLIDRLGQVGVLVALDPEAQKGVSNV